MDLQLANQSVVVTGGASGIGRATAELFAREQARVSIWDISEQVRETAVEIGRSTNCRVDARIVDVADEQSVLAAAEQVESALGPVDHLVHCAAVGSGKFGFPFTHVEPADWKRVLDINIMGMVYVVHAFTPRMVERQSGTMTFLASVAGQIGSQTDPPYSASKAANINFAQCVAKDLAPHNIRVNSVCPGMVQTPLNRGVWEAWNSGQPEDQKMSYEAWAGEKIRNAVPLGRWQQPDDIARTIAFLASPCAENITGQTINVDGGFVMHW